MASHKQLRTRVRCGRGGPAWPWRARLGTGVLVVAALAWSRPALAQRGDSYQVQEATQPSRTHGFPGLLDSQLARKGAFVVDSTSSVRYGLTERLTLGTSWVVPIVLLGGSPSALIEAKYLFYARGGVESTLTGLAGFVQLHRGKSGVDEVTDRVVAGFALSNTTWALTRRDRLTFTAMAGHANIHSVEYEPDLNMNLSTDGNVSLLGVGVGYERFFSNWLGVRLNALSLPAAAASADSAFASGRASTITGANPLNRTLVRGMLLLRPGKWLLTGGVLASAAEPGQPTPWLSVSWSSL
jgi:hypothetical protein